MTFRLHNSNFTRRCDVWHLVEVSHRCCRGISSLLCCGVREGSPRTLSPNLLVCPRRRPLVSRTFRVKIKARVHTCTIIKVARCVWSSQEAVTAVKKRHQRTKSRCRWSSVLFAFEQSQEVNVKLSKWVFLKNHPVKKSGRMTARACLVSCDATPF